MSDSNKQVGFTFTVEAANAIKAIEAMHKASTDLGTGMLQVVSKTTKSMDDLEVVTVKMAGNTNKSMKDLASTLQVVQAKFTAAVGPANADLINKLGDSFISYSTKVKEASKSTDQVVAGSVRSQVNAEKEKHATLLSQLNDQVTAFKRAEDIKINESGTTANKIRAIKQKEADELIRIEQELTSKIIAEQLKIEDFKSRLSGAAQTTAVNAANNRVSGYVASAGSASQSTILSSTSQIQAIQSASRSSTPAADIASYRQALNAAITATRADIDRMVITAREGFTATAQQTRTLESNLSSMRAQFRAVAATIREDLIRGTIDLTTATQRLDAAQQSWAIQARQGTNNFRNALSEAGTEATGLFGWIGKLNLAWRATNAVIDTFLSALKSIPNALIEFQSTFSALEGSFTINPSDPAGMNSLAFSTEAATQSMAYLKQEAMRTGIPIKVLEENYRSFLASTRISGESLTTTNKIFENINTTITALHLSADNAKNTFLALSQMFNKGKVQSEELVKQLGNLLPGAFAAFATATGRSTEQLVREMKAGTVRAHDEMLKFSEFYAKYYSEAFETASAGLNASIGRLSTSWEYLARDIGLLFSTPMIEATKYAEKFLSVLDNGIKSIIKAKDGLQNMFGNVGSVGAEGELNLLKKQLEYLSQHATNKADPFNPNKPAVGASAGVGFYEDDLTRMELIELTLGKIAKLEQTVRDVKAQANVEGKVTEASTQNLINLTHKYYKEAQAYQDTIININKFKEDYASADPVRQLEVDKQAAEFEHLAYEDFMKHSATKLNHEEALNKALEVQINKRKALDEQVRTSKEQFDATQSTTALGAGVNLGMNQYQAADKIKANLEEMKRLYDSIGVSSKVVNDNLDKMATDSDAVDINLSKVNKGSNFDQKHYNYAMQALKNPANTEMIKLTEAIAEQTGMDSDLMKVMVAWESGFKANAVSPAGAKGLGQIMPSNYEHTGITDPFNPTQNLNGMSQMLKGFLKDFDGDITRTVAMYNGGHRGKANNPETNAYRDTIPQLLKDYKEGKGAVLDFSQSVDTSTNALELNNEKTKETLTKIHDLGAENEKLSKAAKNSTDTLLTLELPAWLREDKASALFNANEQFTKMGSQAIPLVVAKIKEMRELGIQNQVAQLETSVKLAQAQKTTPYAYTQGGDAVKQNEQDIANYKTQLNDLKNTENQLKDVHQGATSALDKYNTEFKNGSKVVNQFNKDISRQMKQAGKNDEELYIEGFREQLVNEGYLSEQAIESAVEKAKVAYEGLQSYLRDAKWTQFFKDSFSTAFKDIITGAKSLGDTLKATFDSFINEIIDTSLKHLVNNFQKGFGAILGDLVSLAGAAIVSLLTKKDTKPAVSSVMSNKVGFGTGAMGIADTSGRDLAYNLSLPSVANFNNTLNVAASGLKVLGTSLLNTPNIVSSTIGSLQSMISNGVNSLFKLGGVATSSIKEAVSGVSGSTLGETGSSATGALTGTALAYAGAAYSMFKLGMDLADIANNKYMSVNQQVTASLNAASTAAIGVTAAVTGAAMAAGSTLAAAIPVVGWVVAAAINVGASISDMVDNGVTLSNTLQLFGGHVALLLNDMFNITKKPSATMLSYVNPNKESKPSVDGSYFTSSGNQSASVGVESPFGYIDARLNDISGVKSDTTKDMFLPLLKTIQAFDFALAGSINAVDASIGKDGATLKAFKSIAGQNETERGLKGLNSSGFVVDRSAWLAEVLGKTDTLAGKVVSTWLTALNTSLFQAAGNEANQGIALNNIGIISSILPAITSIPTDVIKLAAKGIKTVADGASYDSVIAAWNDFTSGFLVAQNNLKGAMSDTTIGDFLTSLSSIGVSAREGAAQLISFSKIFSTLSDTGGGTLDSFYQNLVKGQGKDKASSSIANMGLIGGIASDTGYKSTLAGLTEMSDAMNATAQASVQAAIDEENKAIATAGLSKLDRQAAIQQLYLSGALSQSAIDAANFGKALTTSRQNFIDYTSLIEGMANQLGMSSGQFISTQQLAIETGKTLVDTFKTVKDAADVFSTALDTLFSPQQRNLQKLDAATANWDKTVKSVGLEGFRLQDWLGLGTLDSTTFNAGMKAIGDGTLKYNGATIDTVVFDKLGLAADAVLKAQTAASTPATKDVVTPFAMYDANGKIIDQSKKDPSYTVDTTKDINAAQTAADNLAKFNTELAKTFNLIGKTDISKQLADVTNYITDWQDKAVTAGGTISSQSLIALTKDKMTSTFQSLIDEYNGINLTAGNKTFQDAQKFRQSWLNASDEIALKSGYSTEQVKAFGNAIADNRIKVGLEAITKEITDLGKSAARLNFSQVQNSFANLVDKFITQIQKAVDSHVTDLNSYQSIINSMVAEGTKIANDARNAVAKQYESIFQTIIDKTRSIDASIRDKQHNSTNLIETAQLQGDLNSTDLNVRLSAQAKLADLAKKNLSYQTETLMIQAQAAAADYNKPFDPTVQSKQDYINQQLKAIDTLQSLSDQYYTVQIDNAKVLVDVVNQANEKVRQLLVNPTLSTLTPLQQMEEAARQYQTAFDLAQAGDANSASKLTGYADTYLQLAKTYYASTVDYAKIFDSVTNGLKSLNTKLGDPQSSIVTNTAQTVSYLSSIKDMIAQTNQLTVESKKIDLMDVSSAIAEAIGSFTKQLQTIADQLGLLASVDLTTGTLKVTNPSTVASQEALQLQKQQQLAAQNTSASKYNIFGIVGGAFSSTPGMDAFYSGDLPTAIAYARASGMFSETDINGFVNLPKADQQSVISSLKAQGKTFANGGQTESGYIMVGEQGPEIMRLNSPGYVTSNKETSRLLDNSQVVQAIIESTQALVSSNDANTSELIAQQQAMLVKMTQLERRMSGIESNGALAKAG